MTYLGTQPVMLAHCYLTRTYLGNLAPVVDGLASKCPHIRPNLRLALRQPPSPTRDLRLVILLLSSQSKFRRRIGNLAGFIPGSMNAG